MKRVVIAAGGTGGHFYPGLVTALELKARGWEPLLIVKKDGGVWLHNDVVTRLHAEGHVDALRLRLTLSGFTLATSLASCKLRDLRQHEEPIARVA